MAITMLVTQADGEDILASEWNAEFLNIINNALTLISPLTGDLQAGGNDITGLDELALNDASANATAAGRLRRNSTVLTWHDGTAARNVLHSASTTSALTTVGTIGTGVWQGTAVATQYGGTGQNFSATAQGNTLYFSAAGTVSALAPGTSGQFLKTQGAAANPAWAYPITGAIAMAVARKSADESVTSSTTYQDDNHLTFSVGAGETWIVEVTVHYTALTAADIKLGLNRPAASTGRAWVSGLDVGVTSTAGNYSSFGEALGADNPIGGGGAGAEVTGHLRATVTTTNSGSITLQWAQNTSNGTATTIKEGSYLVAYRIS